MITFNDVLVAAQYLTPSDRIRLVQALWETVPPEEWPPPRQEWIDEAQRRSGEYDAGHLTAVPWSEVRASARRAAGMSKLRVEPARVVGELPG
jgi:putative addiction module component (TIGR02574 family)